jgi:hypothetical protein
MYLWHLAVGTNYCIIRITNELIMNIANGKTVVTTGIENVDGIQSCFAYKSQNISRGKLRCNSTDPFAYIQMSDRSTGADD